VWVADPERLDYRGHEIIDLRTPRAARLPRLDGLVEVSRARWLLVDRDAPGFTRILEIGRVVVTTSAVHLVELPE
jgi:hypothetical protein